MIRWCFALLLLANGFYALWIWQQGAPAQAAHNTHSDGRAVPTLVMIDELERPERLALTAKPLPEEQSAPQVIPESCWLVGEFDQKSQADLAVATVQSQQLVAGLETVKVPDEPDYWVHVGPFSSRDKALGVLQKLRARKVDSFLIDDGELKNAISLGFFSQKRSAERLRDKYRELEYRVGIHEVARFRPRYEVYANGRVTSDDLRAALAAAGLQVTPAKTTKKSCI